jgi:hypothetical protein
MGSRMCQMLDTLCVALSLTLVALGGSDSTRRILPSNPELWQTPWQLWDPFRIWLPYPMTYRVCRMRSQMTCKIIFTVPFYRACGAQMLCLLGCYAVGL